MNICKNNLIIVNCCPHNVSVYEGTVFDPTAGGSRGGREVISFAPSGIVATAKSSVEALPSMELNGVLVPTCKRTFAKVSDLPNEEGEMYIVSSLFAAAAKELGRDTSNLLIPYGKVVNEDGVTIGCTGLVRCA